MEEKELLILLQQKNEPAFKELVLQFQDKVFHTCLGMLQNETDAEDLAQDVFIQIYRSIPQFKGDATLSTWIYRIAISKCLDFLRSKKRKKRFGFITDLFNAENNPVYEVSDFIHPGIQQENKEDASILKQKIDELPDNQRVVFILNKIEGLPYKEIAEILNCSAAAIDALLQRAKQNLRKKLSYFEKK